MLILAKVTARLDCLPASSQTSPVMFWLLAGVVFFPPCAALKAPSGCALLGFFFFFFFIIYCSSPFVSVLASSLLVLVLEELVATDGNHGDECHELLEVTLGVAVGVQALHQAVKSGLVFHMLQGRTESSDQDMYNSGQYIK